jgi:hypothetical protein
MDDLRSSMTDEQHQQPLIATEFVKANEASVSLGG